MAEIKSTMDMVMERAAKMAANAPSVSDTDEQIKTGMRLAAEYLDQKLTDLTTELAAQPPEMQGPVSQGMLQALLRNIGLPRDEMLKERSQRALAGVQVLAGQAGAAVITATCSELQQILDQYGQHKKQVTQQLEEALLGQLKQEYMARGGNPADLNAAMHPQYGEEMAKMQGDLNNQYNQAMDQRKEMIRQQLAHL